jgi:hypothetical protein
MSENELIPNLQLQFHDFTNPSDDDKADEWFDHQNTQEDQVLIFSLRIGSIN